MIVFEITGQPPKRDPLFEPFVAFAQTDETFKAKVMDIAKRNNLFTVKEGVVHFTDEALDAYYEARESELPCLP